MNTENLLKLATYLLSDDPSKAKFHMAFFTIDALPSEMQTDCGAVGCAIGHGPYAGIPKLLGESWDGYCIRVFDISPASGIWLYLFSSAWAEIDNTSEGAAKRILHVIRHGKPSDWFRQCSGTAKLTYKNETL